VGVLRIYFNSCWGQVRTDAISFGPSDGPVLAGTDAKAVYPLFGFKLPADSYPIAEWHGDQVRVYPPSDAAVELCCPGAARCRLGQEQLPQAEGRRYVTLSKGASVHFLENDVTLTVTLDEMRDRAGWEKQKAIFWMCVLVIATVAAPLAFLVAGPDPTLPARALEADRLKRGLPLHPELIDLDALGDPEAEQDGAGPRRMVIPASVR
jgi:hypothetical protein